MKEELYEGDSERNSLIPHRPVDQRTMSGIRLIKTSDIPTEERPMYHYCHKTENPITANIKYFKHKVYNYGFMKPSGNANTQKTAVEL